MYLKIWTDGGSRGNPGPAGAGVFITDGANQELFARGFYLGNTTNNVAEYMGLIHALQKARELGGKSLDIFCDSKLMVKQVNGQYKVKSANLKPLYRQVRELMERFDSVRVQHVYRSDNSKADELVNQAMDAGCDVDATGAGPDKTAGSDDISLLDRVQFDPAKPYREVLFQKGKKTIGLVGLEVGQTYKIKNPGTLCAVTVLQGAGQADDQEVRQGTWLLREKQQTITFTAGRRMILLIVIF